MNDRKLSYGSTSATLIFWVVMMAGIIASCIQEGRAADLAMLRGVIKDADGVPVSGAEVYAYADSDVRRPADFISNRTLITGHYHVSLPPGDYWLVARWRKNGGLTGPLEPLDKHSGEPVRIKLTAGIETAHDFVVADIREASSFDEKKREDYLWINGRVLDAEGKPAAGVYVMANIARDNSGIPDYVSHWTEGNGEFELYLPRGEFYIGTAVDFPPPSDCKVAEKSRSVTGADFWELALQCEVRNDE